jgi:mannose-6-phosphate isomerase
MAAPAILDEPLLFERIFLEKVWGGRALERVPGIALPDGKKIGETWELSDREDRNSVVARGSFRGRTLREMMTSHREAILGRARAAADGSFPLLVKLLDATQNLSVQVHPHRGIAHTLRSGESPKTECWYVLAAEPGAGIWHGLRSGVEAENLAAEASGPGIVSLLSWYRAEPGQFFFVPGGTVHSIGAGVTLVEIQETSDTTYRLYDWGREGPDGRPRETSIDRALRAVRQGQALRKPRRPYRRGIARKDDVNKRARCADGEEFAVDLLELCRALDCDTEDVAIVYIALGGQGRLSRSDGGGPWSVKPGDTWLVPASLGHHRIEPEGSLRLLQAITKA